MQPENNPVVEVESPPAVPFDKCEAALSKALALFFSSVTEDYQSAPSDKVGDAAKLALATKGGSLVARRFAKRLADKKGFSFSDLVKAGLFFSRKQSERSLALHGGGDCLRWVAAELAKHLSSKANEWPLSENALLLENVTAGDISDFSAPGAVAYAVPEKAQRRIFSKGKTLGAPLFGEARIKAAELAAVLPADSVAAGVVDDFGRGSLIDLRAVGGVSICAFPFALRKELLVALVGADKTAAVLPTADCVEDMRLGLRSIRGAVDFAEVADGHSVGVAVVKGVSLTGKNGDLLRCYVPPRLPDSPKAVFVSGVPSTTERIIGRPLVGLDGATFKSLYLERLGLDISEVAIVHAQPTSAPQDDEDWRRWVVGVVKSYSGVPVVALGRSASEALREIKHTTMPHPRAVRVKGDRGEVARKARRVKKQVSQLGELSNRLLHCPLRKTDEERRLVYGIVLEPHSKDLQGDVLALDTVEAAAHKYLVQSRTVGDQHSRLAGAEVVESYLAPADLDLGGQIITEGSWVMVVHVTDDALWAAVKRGEYTGFSIGGTGERKEKAAQAQNVLFA